MRIALYLVGALVAVFVLFYLYSLIGAGLMFLWQLILVLAAVAVTVAVVGGLRRARRIGRLRAPESRVQSTHDAKSEKKAEKTAEKELRSLEAALGKEAPPPVRTAPQMEDKPLQRTRRG